MEELEAEAVLLGGPLDELAGVEQHRAHPLAILVSLVDQQHPRLQHTPQLGPALQGATDLSQGRDTQYRFTSYNTHTLKQVHKLYTRIEDHRQIDTAD